MNADQRPTSDSRVVDVLTSSAILSLRRALDGVPVDDPRGHGVPLAVLVDPGLHDPLADHAQTQSLPRLPLHIRGVDRSLSPYLLMLGGAVLGERALDTSIRLAVEECRGLHDREGASPRSVCAWLVPQAMQSTNWLHMQSALGKRAWVKPPMPEPRRVMRFWDPRIACHLPATLGHDTWAECLQALGVQQWWTLAADASLARVGEAVNIVPYQDNWQIDNLQWQALCVLGWRNVVAQAASGWGVKAQSLQKLDDITRRALAHGLTDRADMLVFAHLALTAHLQFDSHPQVVRLLHEWQHGGCKAGGFAGRVEALSEDFTAHLQSGGWLQHAGAAPQTRSLLT